MSVDLTTDVTLNGESVDATVNEDTDGDGTAEYSETVSVANGTNTYTLTSLEGKSDSQYYIDFSLSTASVTSSPIVHAASIETLAPEPPENVSATVNDDDSIDVTWEPPSSGPDVNEYRIEINRDGNGFVSPSGGPVTVSEDGSASYTANYNPQSDTAYSKQVGIDSSFDFRVRAENSSGESDWTTSETVHTRPVTPKNPTISRPSSNKFTLEFTVGGDNVYGTKVAYREDTGNGFGGWTNFDWINDTSDTDNGTDPTVKGNRVQVTWETGQSYHSNYNGLLKEDARYQFRIQHQRYTPQRDTWSIKGDFVAIDYGNLGNVYFEDDFETGDLSNWDATNLSDDWGVYDGTFIDSHASSDDFTQDHRVHPVQDADEGTYYLFGDGDGYVQKNLGDLSSETDVIIQCAMAVSSMDGGGETGKIQWYDGSSWVTVKELGWEYNRQGWVEVSVSIDDSMLSADNRLRLHGYGGSGDYTAWDRVVVSDRLHEYTMPTPVTNFTVDTTASGEVTGTWDDNADMNGWYEFDYRAPSNAWQDGRNKLSENATSSTHTGLTDGEVYEFRVAPVVAQDRYGERDRWNFTRSEVKSETVIPNTADAMWSLDSDWDAAQSETSLVYTTFGDNSRHAHLQQGYQVANIERGLVAYYPFEQGQSNHLHDAALNNRGRIHGGSWSSDSRIGDYCLHLNSNNNEYVAVDGTKELEIRGDVTVSAWVKLYNVNRKQVLVQYAKPTENEEDNMLYGIRTDGDGNIEWWHEYGGGSNVRLQTYQEILADDQWVHIAAVRDDDAQEVRMYVEGNHLATGSYSNSATGGENAHLEIGHDNAGSGKYVNGLVGEVMVHDRTLSRSEIEWLADDSRVQPSGSPQLEDPRDSLISEWKLDGDATDSEGTHDGTVNGATFVTGYENQAASFNGTDDDIAFSSFPTDGGPVGWSAWVKVGSKDGDWESILRTLKGSRSNFQQTGGDGIQWHIDNGTNTTSLSISSAEYETGEWIHFAGTFDNGEARLYMNGELRDINTSLSGNLASTDGTFRMGSANGAEFFDGEIDEVRVYERALEPREIEQLYHMGRQRLDANEVTL